MSCCGPNSIYQRMRHLIHAVSKAYCSQRRRSKVQVVLLQYSFRCSSKDHYRSDQSKEEILFFSIGISDTVSLIHKNSKHIPVEERASVYTKTLINIRQAQLFNVYTATCFELLADRVNRCCVHVGIPLCLH